MPQELTEEMYANVAEYRERAEYSEREKLAIEYAERFALDHLSIDDGFFERLRSSYSDKEILELSTCIGAFLGMGRNVQVLGLNVSCSLDV